MNIFIGLFLFACTATPGAISSLGIPEEHKQVILVSTPSWTSQEGSLQKFSRFKGKCVAVGPKIPVTVGRKGLGWGKGFNENIKEEPGKVEGDGRAPAGIFATRVGWP